MKVLYLDQWRNPSGQHATISQYLIGRALEDPAFSFIDVFFLLHDPLEKIVSALKDPSYKVIVVSQHILTVRVAARKLIRKLVKMRGDARRILFTDDVIGGLWWREGYIFNEFWGTQFFPSYEWMKRVKSFWHKRSPPSTPCKWFPPFLPPLEESGCESRLGKIIFPSREFGHHYPERFQWYKWLQARPSLLSSVELCTSKTGHMGPNFLKHLGRFKACLVVIPSSGYIIRKIFECFLVKTLVICIFQTPNETNDLADTRKALEAMGFFRDIHYLEGTSKNLEKLFDRALHQDCSTITKSAFDHAATHHRLSHRLDSISSYLKTLIEPSK